MTTTTKTNLSIGCRLRIFVIDIRILFVFGFLFFAATTSLATAEFLMTHNTDEADRQYRIINGEEVLEDRFPYFALMYGTSMCGAVLIGPRLALGAAHCANASTNLRIGARDGRKSGVQINIQEVMAHPGHDSYNYTNDIALFYLEYPTDIPYLPPDPRPIFEVDTPLTVIGFGDTKKEENVTQLSHHLLEVELKYVDSELCDQKHGGLGEVTDDMMCAKGEVGDSCRGDR
jgi:secreted trypsin-like serine protease